MRGYGFAGTTSKLVAAGISQEFTTGARIDCGRRYLVRSAGPIDDEGHSFVRAIPRLGQEARHAQGRGLEEG